jgi:uncharacterized protein YhaN
MRLKQLDLVRYGCFTGHTIDFGHATPGQPDLHVIYGENEAGKSTVFAAYLDLLFGIEVQSRFGFRHAYDTMQVMATLEQDGTPATIKRIKRQQNSLLDTHDAPLPEGFLARHLSGLNRAQCLAMFSLDDDSIEKGGDGILASEGELGSLLFAASTGLANLSERLLNFGAEADAFHRKSARKTELRTLKAELEALKEEKLKHDVQASEYLRRKKDRDTAQQNYDAAHKARNGFHATREINRQQLNALPHFERLRELEQRIALLGDVDAVKPGWKQEAQDPKLSVATLAVKRASLSRDKDRIAAAFNTLARDPEALPLKAELVALAELQARFLTAQADLPSRRKELDDVAREIAGAMASLGHGGETRTETVLLTESTIRKLKALIAQSSVRQLALDAATRECNAIRERLAQQDTREGVLEIADDDAGFDALKALTNSLASGTLLQDFAAAKTIMADNERKHAEAFLKLLPWQGEPEALNTLIVPSIQTVRDWIRQKDSLVSEQAGLESEIDGLKAECRRYEASCGAIRSTAQPITDTELAKLRSDREVAWRVHIAALNQTTAQAFEEPLRLHDAGMERRLTHAAAIDEVPQRADGLGVIVAITDDELAHATECVPAPAFAAARPLLIGVLECLVIDHLLGGRQLHVVGSHQALGEAGFDVIGVGRNFRNRGISLEFLNLLRIAMKAHRPAARALDAGASRHRIDRVGKRGRAVRIAVLAQKVELLTASRQGGTCGAARHRSRPRDRGRDGPVQDTAPVETAPGAIAARLGR